MRKLSNDERKELQLISAALGAAQPPANDLAVAWVGSDLLKAQGNKEYVPFTFTLDPARLSAERVSLYWRVSPATTCGSDVPAAADSKTPAQSYAFENLNTLTIPKGQSGPYRVSRSFVVCPGTYDVSVVIKEPTPKKKGEVAKTGFVRQSVTVPDLWNGELTTSSVILAERIDPLPAPLTPAQVEERPYALGNMEILPASSTRLSKRAELSVFLLIYNARIDATNAAPDVTVEYNFYSVQSGAEKFFNKTNPQALNAQTLPPGFDAAAGMTNGQTIPLASFPEGEYRLEIKITDKLATRSLTRDVKFSVSGS
ncbi:MAG TPA: hypothetical protein VM032_13255 [Vicinamibacterales bacterium]|nr:hypothetical protein [Vicinamibacterales bacterium]